MYHGSELKIGVTLIFKPKKNIWECGQVFFVSIEKISSNLKRITMGCCLSEFAEELPMFAKEEKRKTSNSDSDDRRSWKRRRSSSEDDGGFKDWQGR